MYLLRKHRVLPIRIQGLRLKYGQVRKEHCWFVMPTFIIAQIMPNSSVKAAAKIYCICDEFKSIEEFLEKRPELKEELEKPVISLKYISYRWNLFRLTMEFKYAFLERMHKELSEAKNRGLFDKKYFTEKEWTDINRLVDDMDAFFDETFRKELLRFGSEAELAKALKKSENKVIKLQKKIDDMENSSSLKIGRAITFVPRKLKKMLH